MISRRRNSDETSEERCSNSLLLKQKGGHPQRPELAFPSRYTHGSAVPSPSRALFSKTNSYFKAKRRTSNDTRCIRSGEAHVGDAPT